MIINLIKQGESCDSGCYLFFGNAGYTQPFLKMADGYFSAAVEICEIAQKTLQDELVYPIWFLFRHSIELKIKAICLFALMQVNKSDSSEILNKKKELLSNGHSLTKLWNNALELLKNKISELKISESLISEISVGIKEINDFDETSFEMRYPTNKSLVINQSLSETYGLEINKLKEGMNSLWHKLGDFQEPINKDQWSLFTNGR